MVVWCGFNLTIMPFLYFGHILHTAVTSLHCDYIKMRLHKISISIFQSLIDYKIFNRNTVKVSYSCMQNMSKIYKGQIVRLHPHHVTNWYYVSVEKKENVSCWCFTIKIIQIQENYTEEIVLIDILTFYYFLQLHIWSQNFSSELKSRLQ